MKRLLLCLAWLLLICAVSAWSQSLYVFPIGPLSVPRGTTQTVTANVNGVNNKGLTWSTNHGTLVGVNPCVLPNEPCTIGLYDATAETDTLTATTTVGSVVGTATIVFTASPTIATGHPRLYMGGNGPSIASLQAKATSGNVIYQKQLAYTQAQYTDDLANWTFSTWSGSACTGGSGPTGFPETDGYDAVDFAFMGDVASTSTLRNQYGCAGRDVWVYVMTNIISGAININGNAWSDSVLPYAHTGDWLMGGGYLSASDITLQRQFNAWMLHHVLADCGVYGVVPPVCASGQPCTAYNSPTLLSNYGSSNYPTNLSNQRAMGNNYTYSSVLYTAALSMMFDDNTTDDPPLTGAANTCGATRYQMCADFTAGSMHAYENYFMGEFLWQEWAHLDDPNVVQQAYNAAFSNTPSIPNCQLWNGTVYPCFGDGRGGESSEGSYYQYSLFKLRYMLNILYTTGNNDPTIWGPQVSLGTSSFWDQKDVSDLAFLTGINGQNGANQNNSTYSFITTGDTYTYYRWPSGYETQAATLVFDSYTGRADRTSQLLWPILVTPNGGPLGTTSPCNQYCGFDNNVVGLSPLALDLIIALPAGDPTASVPADPRPSLPTDIYNPSFNQNQIIRNGWTGGYANSVFDYRCTHGLINHEVSSCGEFLVFDNNEYITKPRVEFNDYNTAMVIASQANEVQTVNPTGTGANGAWQFVPLGGQWFDGPENSLPVLYHSELPTYVADIADQTGMYNGWPAFNSPYDTASYNGQTGASRSLIYLRGVNQIVYFDRAATGSTATSKTNYLTTTGAVTVSGNQASWLTQSGTQKAYLTALLPSGATMTGAVLVKGISISAPYSQMQNSTTMQAVCDAIGTDGTSTNVSAASSWTSSNTGVATIGSTGLITAVGTGTTTIQCGYVGTVPRIISAYVSGNVTVAGSNSGTLGPIVGDSDQYNDWEAYGNVAIGAGSVVSTNFLSFLEWGPSAMSSSNPVLVNSSSGQSFSGAVSGDNLVMFSATYPLTFTGTTFPASSALAVYVADLVPNTSYPITGAGTPSTATSDTAGVLEFAATGTGSITVGSGTPQAATPTFSPTAGTYAGAQSVTISTSSSGAILCYNTTGSPATNGSTGCTTGTLYSTPVSVATSETLYAVAGGTGYSDSTGGSAAYTITAAVSGVVQSGVVSSGAVTQ